jgi:hypothetical protein
MIENLRFDRRGAEAVRIWWTSTLEDPSFYVWVDGFLVSGELKQNWFDIIIPSGATFRIDVFDNAVEAPGFAFPGTVLLQWDAVTDATNYRVEEWDGAAWVVRARIPETGRSVYQWESSRLADDTAWQFRVLASDGANDSAPREFTGLMVRRPDAPNVTHSYVDGVLISEAVA